MKSKIKQLIVFLLCLSASFASLSCVREDILEGCLSDGEGWLLVNFSPSKSVEVITKATQNATTEDAVNNLYVFLFDSEGNKLYGRWLTSSERKASTSEVNSATTDAWYVSNATESTTTTGCFKIKASAGNGFSLYVISNLDSDMARISSDLLSHNISKESDLLNFKLQLNQETVNRNTNFPMVASLKGISITAGQNNTLNGGSQLMLQRIDAKVRFVFKTGTRPDNRGQVIKNFEARQWKVVNVPTTAYVVGRESDDATMVDPSTPTSGYDALAPYFFETEWRNFEDITTTTQEFSFYMMENRQTPKATPATYQERSRQVKSAGKNLIQNVEYTSLLGKAESRDIKIFENANDFSTYVLVTGRVDMDLNDDDGAGKTLGADVQYMIHLGSWNSIISDTGWKDDVYSDFDNYKTERNHSYTYTVTINSVDNIRVEVETSKDPGGSIENQPGAIGEVVIAKEEIAVCDAHYVSKTMTFHAKNFYTVVGDGKIESYADKLTWKVKTPFGREGAPLVDENGIETYNDLDYKWVHFRLNKQDAGGNYFQDKRRKYTTRVYAHSDVLRLGSVDNKEDDGTDGLSGYHNDGCMDIIQLVAYIKDQVELYVEYHNAVVEAGSSSGIENKSDFDNGYLEDGTQDPDGAKICVTTFVDEFYYDKDPVTGRTDRTLWKSFVNQPDRSMHILCDSYSSSDSESTATGSVITIQQHSIQSFFNDDPSFTSLHTAWGLEHEDEFPEKWTWGDDTAAAGNNDYFNGLLNSARLWGLCPSSDYSYVDTQQWSDYMNIEVNNDTPQLNDEKSNLRYSCMTRNRDNNGNGIIDRDEVRWYTASIRQLIGIYMAEGIITPSSRLYNRSAADRASTDKTKWMQHVISSTQDGGNPILVWAEEGISTGVYTGGSDEGASKELSVRCLRNLGMTQTHPLDSIPDDYIVRSYVEDHTVFTCTNINEASLRDYTSVELPRHFETDKENYLYKKFEVANEKVSGDAALFNDFNNTIDNAIASGAKNPYCPEGYRTPNQREVAIMAYNFLDDGSGGNTSLDNPIMTRTSWSFGKLGLDKDTGVYDKYGFIYIGVISLQYNGTASTTRCVRDVRVD
ncbi:MAG: fimbrial protein [Candidatus Cryptobacteroides sp.]